MAGVGKTALNHFDKFYPYVYTNSLWKSIRLGLLCSSKKMFLINNACSFKKTIISNLQKNGAINFLENLITKEKIVENESSEYLYLKHNTRPIGLQLDEFVKSKEYIGERTIYTKSISNSFANYMSDKLNEKKTEEYTEKLKKHVAEMLPYEKIVIPPNLSVLAYPRGVIKKPFPVTYDEFNQSAFYPIDGFSIMAVLIMNLKKGDKVFDMCSAPGGKAVSMLQTGLLGELVCIDQNPSRIARLNNVLKSHSFVEDIESKVSIITADSTNQAMYMENYFDKVLLDTPCSTDRHAILDKKFNLFARDNFKKMIGLYQKQHNLLKMAIKSCKVGGEIVYSTCTLSPAQNEKVIITVIDDFNSKNKNCQVKLVHCQSEFINKHHKYSNRDKPSDDWFSCFYSPDTVGQIVLPNILNNYGPGYICKLKKVPI